MGSERRKELERRILELEQQLADAQSSESRCLSLLQSVAEGVILQDRSGEILFWNARASEVFSLEPSEIVGRDPEKISWLTIHEDGSEYPESEHPSKITLQTGAPISGAIMGVLQAGGERRWISINTRPIFEADSEQPAAVAISFADVTDRRHADEQLKAQQRKVRTLLSNLPGLVYRTRNDPDWPLDFVSGGCLALTGYSIEELSPGGGVRFGDLIHSDDTERVWAGVQEAIRDQRHFELEYRIIDKAGLTRQVYERGVPVFDDQGKLETIEGFITDMTLRERTVALEQQQRQFLQLLIDSIPVSVFYKDLDGVYLGCNSAYAAFLGLPKSEIVGREVHSIFPEAMAQVYAEADAALFATPGIQQYETRMRHADGTLRDVLFAKATFRDQSGRVGGLIGVMSDLTDRIRIEDEKRLLEAQLRQSQKAEALGLLAGGIAHDFNNILMTMLGFSELALDASGDGSEAGAHMSEVIKAGRRAKNLVSQILTFSRQARTRREPVRLEPALRDGVAMLRATLPSTISLEEQLFAPESVVLADVNQIHQILVNLATNAAHAVDEPGARIEIGHEIVNWRTEHILGKPSRRAGRFARIRVRDNGRGIPSEHLDTIFDPYFTTKAQGKGTGLGLAVVQGIARGHEGWVEVESETGVHTTFDVFIPIAEGLEPGTLTSSGRERRQRPRGSGSILLVDDEPAIVRLQTFELQRLGYTVEGHTDPAVALASFEKDPARFDLVLTDMTMPEIPGDDLARRIKAVRPEIPVILCTGYSNRLGVQKEEPKLLAECLLKPVTFSQLGQSVQRVLDAARAESDDPSV